MINMETTPGKITRVTGPVVNAVGGKGVRL
jgi:hypothetical protein